LGPFAEFLSTLLHFRLIFLTKVFIIKIFEFRVFMPCSLIVFSGHLFPHKVWIDKKLAGLDRVSENPFSICRAGPYFF
jgi:hypothetical protein